MNRVIEMECPTCPHRKICGGSCWFDPEQSDLQTDLKPYRMLEMLEEQPPIRREIPDPEDEPPEDPSDPFGPDTDSAPEDLIPNRPPEVDFKSIEKPEEDLI